MFDDSGALSVDDVLRPFIPLEQEDFSIAVSVRFKRLADHLFVEIVPADFAICTFNCWWFCSARR